MARLNGSGREAGRNAKRRLMLSPLDFAAMDGRVHGVDAVGEDAFIEAVLRRASERG